MATRHDGRVDAMPDGARIAAFSGTLRHTAGGADSRPRLLFRANRPASAGDARLQALLLILLAGLILASVSGCDRLTRHKVMTIFFTGVPSLEEQDRSKEAELENAKKPKPAGAPQTAAARKPRRSTVLGSSRFSHGPYAANTCYECHEVSASGGLRGFGKKEEAAGSIAKAGVVPGKLVAPLTELCVRCHDSKSPAKAFQAGLWVHGPVSSGYCILCHGPHTAAEPALLLKQADAICVECHAVGMVHSADVHRGRQDCMACHNPHVGRDSRLLKAEHQELW